MHGYLNIRILDLEGNIVEESGNQNIVVTGSIAQLARLVSEGDSGSTHYISKMQFGTGTIPATVSDTALQSPISPVKAVTFTYPETYQIRFVAYLLANEANGFPITEAGLLTGGNTLMSRRVFAAKNKTSDYQYEFVWLIDTKNVI